MYSTKILHEEFVPLQYYELLFALIILSDALSERCSIVVIGEMFIAIVL